ncbi:MAG: tRNA (adenosine(37)-N6)-threonylcarbamoyltransferase complex dimerization subunit type 1 TsaB [Candidatus Aminicenantes bacterium]|jgi:tRNA threonylcarbamoyladenosine biosynthesis protein TsaB
MIILAVDTTTPAGSVALLKGKAVLSEINTDSVLTFSERLLPAIHFVLQIHGLKSQDIEAFALAVGPGSFTGIRIGVSTVKSFAYASGKPVAPVSSLKALALKLHNQGGRLFCPVLDAKKGEIYAALFESKRGRLKEIIPEGAYSPDSFLSRLPARRIISFIGNGMVVYREKIFEYLRDKARFPTRSLFIAREVGLLGYELLKEKKGVRSWDVEPLYFRKSQAEEIH